LPPQPAEVCVMDLDRPFLFVIRQEGVPLFVGVVNQL
jgi:serpin B